MEVNSEPGCGSESIQNGAERSDGTYIPAHQNECVIGILEDRARKGAIHGVGDDAMARRFLDEALQNIRDYDEKVWGKGITLPEPAFAIDPAAGHSVEHDCSFPGRQNAGDSTSP
jgi:hypothetical protein